MTDANRDEAERLALIIHNQVGGRPMAAADTIALGQLHALICLADRVDQLVKAVRGDGR